MIKHLTVGDFLYHFEDRDPNQKLFVRGTYPSKEPEWSPHSPHIYRGYPTDIAFELQPGTGTVKYFVDALTSLKTDPDTPVWFSPHDYVSDVFPTEILFLEYSGKFMILTGVDNNDF